MLEVFADPRLDIRPSVVGDEDVIGNVYEYLLERFASDTGKKAGEFYTPGQVSTLLARLLKPKKGDTIRDPACGSGSLLIKVGRQADDRDFALFGQESNGTTHALCRMNIFLHDMENFRIEWGDMLRNPRLVEGDQLMKFDIVVANPPFSLDQWGIADAEADPFHRYHRGIPPKGKGDYAFITHRIETARTDSGRVGVVVPHDVLFIDASRDYADAKNQNILTEAHLEKIVATFRAFQTVDKYAYRATAQQIADNDYNLNIPRYVDTFEEEAEIDLKAVKKEIAQLEGELVAVRKKMDGYLKELGL